MKPDIGITATLPVEIIFAAGFKPVDLNNLFIDSENAAELIGQAESAGFAHNICAWIKGIYATVLDRHIKTVVAVTGGDCSNTIALGEVLTRRGVEVIPFEYPLNRDRKVLAAQMDRLRERLSASWWDIESVKRKLDKIRRKLNQLDLLSYSGNVVSGLENHLFLVSSSDFSGDPEAFEEKLDRFLQTVQTRKPRREEVRLGYLGVPPIFAGFYEFIESLGGRIVFNEVQRQFSMPALRRHLVDQYLEYTYPYAMGGRLKDILEAVETRRLDGLIHYTQTFCYRQIYDILLRESVAVPVLTLEGDRPGQIDSRTAFRIETFVEMLSARKFG
jgi:benzoyl-CoA reductase/2-hydroxyglutaryl-CoA dehydratase subunit BcrC/BadD/HgdB